MPDKLNVKKMGAVYNKSYKPWHSEALADYHSYSPSIDPSSFRDVWLSPWESALF